MARVSKGAESFGEEDGAVMQVGGDDLPPLVDAAPVVAEAALKSPEVIEVVEEPPVVKRARVVIGGTFAAGGYRANLRPGKIVDSLNYDLEALQRGGIVLEMI